MIGIKALRIAIIVTCAIILNSCSKDYNSYTFTIRNEYFESLYHTKIGDFLYDTIVKNETTPLEIIHQGSYVFTTETESGLLIKSHITFQGERKNIQLILYKNGRLIIK